MYSFINVCEYLENLISVQTLLLFDYTGSALKGDQKIAPRTNSPGRSPLRVRVWVRLRVGGSLLGRGAIFQGRNFPSNALKNTDE